MTSTDSNPAPSIAAVAITYRRLALLKECIAAVRAQTRPPDEIIVVNNGGADDTAEWLAGQADLTVISQDNVGSSGAFHVGFQTAYDRGHDWIWSMDDDGRPNSDVLEMFELAIGTDLSEYKVLNSKVYASDTKQDLGDSLEAISELRAQVKYQFTGARFFNGTFIHRRAIEEVGNVNRDLFMWGDETNYFMRCKRAYGVVPVILDCLHYHPYTAVNAGGSSSMKQYYTVRNAVYNALTLSRFGLLGVAYVFFLNIRRVIRRQVSMKVFLIGSYTGLTKHLGNNHERFNFELD